MGTNSGSFTRFRQRGRDGSAYPIFFLITTIFGATAFLAYKKTITGEAFLILGGTVVGYLLSFLGDYVAPAQGQRSSDFGLTGRQSLKVLPT